MEMVVAEPLLSLGIEKVWDLLVRESGRITGVDKQLIKLKNDFELLMSFLEDADAKKHANKVVKSCVEQVKEITFDTQDIIETFLLKEELRKTSGIKQLMKKLPNKWKFAKAMEDLSKRISDVTTRMRSNEVQQMNINGRQDVQSLEEKQREIRKTFPSNNENLVGLDENVKELVGYLVEEYNIRVVSITGMGGIGKTTLAQQVFNHKMVTNHFDGVVWVCLSQQFTRKYVWETIFKKLGSKHGEQKDSKMTEEELQDKLLLLLESSNSLIVLDDIWKEEDWDLIKHAFPSKKGCKILLTSRNELVALHIDPKAKNFKPECLNFDNSWTLFQMTAFPSKDTRDKVDEEMEEMGKKMIKHCGGLPLGVKVLGGVLAIKYTLSEWKMVFENIEAHVIGGTSFNDRNISSVYNILYLSFEKLPIYLKHCFFYLAYFPEDSDIDVDQLSYLWAVEGVPRPRFYNRSSIREVGDGYIEELVNRNMVISEKDVITSRFKTCRLHDMMREVCLHKAKEENFLQTVDITSITNSEDVSTSRRVAVHWSKETDVYEGGMMNPKLRSLLMIGNKASFGLLGMSSNICFERLQLMRVLDLSFIEFEGEKIPSSIGKLIHLRYLSLCEARVSHLPSSMQNLKKMIYLNLNVRQAAPMCMPNFMKNMRELAYLSLPLDIGDEVHLELGNLANVETLENLPTNNSNVKDLHQMTRLKRLSINYNGGCTMGTISSSLSRLTHLEYFKIYHYQDEWFNGEEEFVLDFVNLKQLKIHLHKLKLPLQHLPLHLTTINLKESCLKENPMPILEKLLQLKEVTLVNISLCGSLMVCSKGGFPQLQKLNLRGLDKWEEWIAKEGSMPLLHTLRIHYCRKLKQLPDGLRFITSLKYLNIYFMGNVWEEKLSEGGEDYYKVQHIPHISHKLW